MCILDNFHGMFLFTYTRFIQNITEHFNYAIKKRLNDDGRTTVVITSTLTIIITFSKYILITYIDIKNFSRHIKGETPAFASGLLFCDKYVAFKFEYSSLNSIPDDTDY